jgi:hypothetical protein
MEAVIPASSSLYKITPEDLPLASFGYDTAWFQGQFYLSLLRHDSRRRTDLRRVMRWDAASRRWTMVYEQFFGDVYRDKMLRELGSEQSPAQCSTEILITPDVHNADGMRFVFHSPLGLYCLRLCEGDTGIIESEALPPVQEPWKYVSWQHHQGLIFALVEKSDGSRHLIWSENAGSAGSWQPLSSPDARSQISALTVFDGSLVVAVDNEVRGFGIWKLCEALLNGESYSWEPILSEGALRYSLNSNVCSIATWEGALYVAAGISDEARIRKYGSSYHARGFELLRCYAGGDWDIIFGSPRFTPRGLKVPLARSDADGGELLAQKLIFFLAGDAGFSLGAESELGFQVWTSRDAEEWISVGVDIVASYQTVSVVGAHDTVAGPLIVAETTDYELKRFLNIWLGTPGA